MLRLFLVATLLAGCRISLEDESTAFVQCEEQPLTTCTALANSSSLAEIQTNAFPICASSGCHGGTTYPTLTPGMSHANLVNQPSMIAPGRMLVVPGNPNASYLMVMLGAIPPEMAEPPAPPPPNGIMPSGASEPMCCQRLDAIERWIVAGAPNN